VNPDAFGRLTNQYQARIKALDAAMEKSREINVGLNIVTFGLTVGALAFVWAFPSIRLGIGAFVVVFVLRWIANVVVRVKWADPELARIEREFPVPGPHEFSERSNGRPRPGSGIDRTP
jgi:hypothetical protein